MPLKVTTPEPRRLVVTPVGLTASELQNEYANSPYRRDDWYGDPELDRTTPDQITHDGTDKIEWIAHTLLRRQATFLCPHCMFERDEHVPISDPEEAVPRTLTLERGEYRNIHIDLAVMPMAHRVCEACGAMSFGGPIQDRDFEAFKELLEEACSSAKFVDYPDAKREQAKSDALAAKGREDGPHDKDIMRSFVEALVSPEDRAEADSQQVVA